MRPPSSPAARPLDDVDHDWARSLLHHRWGDTHVVARGVRHDALHCAGFVAMRDDERIGLVTYRIENDECEVVTLDAVEQRCGVGSLLLAATSANARSAGCARIWLITTNDNLPAIHFYQKQGWDLVAFHRHALQRSRELKPSIPTTGFDGIPLEHELEFELRLRR